MKGSAVMPRPYSDYINVNKEFVPVFSAHADRQYPNHWKSFFPHSTFTNILGNLVSSLEGDTAQKRLSLWIYGPYGTGKSFASFVLKHIIEENDDEARSYFEKYGLSATLLGRLEAVKSKGEILVVNRADSSGIIGDNRLYSAIQESVKQALKDKGYQLGGKTLYDSVVTELQDPDSEFNFTGLFNKNKGKFLEYNSADEVVEDLIDLGPEDGAELVERIIDTSKLSGNSFARTADDVIMWLKDVKEINNLKAIVFIWDEFTEFFRKNQNSTSGFQSLAQASADENNPFYFVVITHKNIGQFVFDAETRKKLEARFKLEPIAMANTTAFMLMRQALDFIPDLKSEWDNIASNLWIGIEKATKNSICKYDEKINPDDLRALLPLHSFSAFMLQWISAKVNSNQRTMFQFLVGDPNATETEKHNFRWYIQNHDVNDWCYLTCDYIWDYFFDLENEDLDDKAKSAIIHYSNFYKQCDNENEERVLKVVLLLTAMQQEKGQGVSNLLRPTKYNLIAAFAGTPVADSIEKIMNKFVQKGIVGCMPEGDDALYVTQSQNIDPDKYKELDMQMRVENSFEKIISNVTYNLPGNFALTGYAAQRFEVKCCTNKDLKAILNSMRVIDENKVPLIFMFAKTEEDSVNNYKAIQTAVSEYERDFIIVDTSSQTLSNAEYENFIKYKVKSAYFLKVNMNEARLNEGQAKSIIDNWKSKINNADIKLYSKVSDPVSLKGIGQFNNRINELNSKIYKYGLETLTSNDKFFAGSGYSAKVIMMGMEHEPIVGSFSYLGNFKNNMASANIWNNPNYYKVIQAHALSQMKIAVEKCIAENFDVKSSVCIADIWSLLKDKPFGLLECTGTAFVMGFLLKEYANSGYYRKDGIKNNVPLSHENLADMIFGIIKGLKNSDNLYIVKMTEEHERFCKFSGEIFKLSADKQNSIQDVQQGIRSVLPNTDFPLWALKYYVVQNDKYGIKDQVLPIIDLYCEFVSYTKENGRDETKVAEDIVKAFNKDAVIKDYFCEIFNSQNLKTGMDIYITEYNKDLAPLADRLQLNKGYVAEVKSRLTDFSAWLWDKGEIDNRINDVYNDYKLLEAINKILYQPVNSFSDAAVSIKNRLSAIRIPYDFFKPQNSSLQPLFTELIKIYQSTDFKEVNKAVLYDELISKSDEFKSFYNNAQKFFNENIGALIGENVAYDEAEHLYNNAETGALLHPVDDFATDIKQQLQQYQKNKKYNILLEKWHEITKSKSPAEWSRARMIPILCLFTNCLSEAKQTFDIINAGKATSNDYIVETAISFIEKNKNISVLGNQHECEAIFKKFISGHYDLLITDIKEIQNIIADKLGNNVYDWYLNKNVIDEIVKDYANEKYKKTFYNDVLTKIDKLLPEQLKEYLIELVKNEPLVGIKIMKN